MDEAGKMHNVQDHISFSSEWRGAWNGGFHRGAMGDNLGKLKKKIGISVF